MKTLISLVALAFALTTGVASAADAEKKPTAKQGAQQQKMKSCNKDAGDKKLKGDERKAFMKECLSAGGEAKAPAADSGCAAKAAEKKLAGAAKTSFVKKCETDAKAEKTEKK